jgi:N-acetylmuramoyl-L-alanine amidase
MPQRKIGIVVAAGLVGLSVGLPAQAQKSKPKPTPGALWASRFGGTVRVLYGLSPLPIANPSRMPYRDARDSAICVAPESLAVLGIAATVEGNSVKLVCSDRNLVMVAARQGPFERSGGVFVDIVEVLKAMGIAALSYDTESATLIVRSVLLSVTLEGEALHLSAGLPISPKVTLDDARLRATIEVSGATIGELPRQLALSSSKVLAVRVQQQDENTVRLIVDFSEPLSLAWTENKPTINALLRAPGAVEIATPVAPAVVVPKPVTSIAKANLSPTMVLKKVSATVLGEDRLRFHLEASRLPVVRPTVQKDTLTLDFGNIYLADSAKSAASALAELKHPLIKSAQLVPVGASAARLVVELASQVGYTIKNSKGGGLLLDLLTPRKTEGPLAGRTIVVDPGHGGSSTGNPGHDGIYERALTLPMSLVVAQTLEELGANVILTRESNFDPGLSERAQIANRAGADLFVSVHCNDGTSNHTIRGTEVYYHANEPVSRDLARFIADKARQGVSAIPVRGVLSDYRIYPGEGFSVLRNSQMAGVLVETGYMSNSADYAALKNKDVQTQLGIAIAQGIADFFAANPDPTRSRFAKPQPVRDYGFPPLLVIPENASTESSVK